MRLWAFLRDRVLAGVHADPQRAARQRLDVASRAGLAGPGAPWHGMRVARLVPHLVPCGEVGGADAQRSRWSDREPEVGFEPTTYRLQGSPFDGDQGIYQRQHCATSPRGHRWDDRRIRSSRRIPWHAEDALACHIE